MSLLVAVGGNAVHPENIKGTTEEQERIAERAAHALLPLAGLTDRLLIVHGNGPVVGKILLRMMLTRDAVPPMRLDVCVAHSQGGIGYMLIQALETEMRRTGVQRDATCVVTQVEVDPKDPAFTAPSKPIGPFFSEAEARDFEKKGWRMMEDAGRGWRHCVPSPDPRSVLNLGVIKRLMETGMLVIAGGGGGVPVTRDAKGNWQGVQAVIDKDLTSAHIATVLGIRHLLMLTATPKVAIDFGKPGQRWLDRVSLRELKAMHADGQFPPGSMGPKIDAAIRFLESGGERAVIAHLEAAMPALLGDTGTHITADNA